MSVLDLSSQVTFLYFKKLKDATDFFEGVLQLERVYDTGWCHIWKTGEKAFVGAVEEDHTSLKIDCRGGLLVSLTVHNIEEVHKVLETAPMVSGLTPICQGTEVPVKSTFMTGPEGYKFEIQQFTDPKLIEIF